MKTILVPTDFSDCAQNAEEVAIRLARLMRAQIHFYHFMSVPVDWMHLNTDQRELYPDISKTVALANHQLLKRVAIAEKAGVEAHYFIGYNSEYENILQHTDDYQVHLIVMGSHGAKGVKEFFMGSNAQKTVRYSRVPVLIIKEQMEKLRVTDILFVSNFEDEMVRPFEQVLDFAELIDAKVSLLYVNTPANFNETWMVNERMESFVALASDRLLRASVVNAFDFERGVERYCQDHHEGLVAIATHNQRGLSKLFLGNLSEKIVNHLDIPVITFPIEPVGELVG